MLTRLHGILLALAFSLLAGCGGGSSGGGGSSSSGGEKVQTFGSFALAISGGGAPGVKHAWVRIYQVALNEDADRPWDPQDTTWSVIKLAQPVSVDLAATGAQFVVGSDSTGESVRALTYKQVRLFFLPHDDSTTVPVVKRLEGGTTQLTYHAQLEYDDQQIVPIEWPSLQSGVKLDQGVVISGGKRSALYSRFDVERSIVRFNGDGAQDSVFVRPRTYTYLNAFSDSSSSDGGKASLILGLIDPAQVCGEGVTTNCVSDLMVSLHAPSGDGTRLENWGSVRVKPFLREFTPVGGVTTTKRDAAFLLGPVSYSLSDDGSGFINPQKYDILIRGRGMKTMLIKNVNFDNFITNIGCTGGDEVSSQITPVLDGSPRSVSMSATSLAPKAGRVGLGFKLDDGLTYEAYSANTDPFTGRLTPGASLAIPSSANATIMVADLKELTAPCPTNVSKTTISLNNRFQESIVPSSGLDQWIAYGIGTFYTDASQSAPFTFASTEFDAPSPTAIAGISNGQVTVSVSGLPSALAGFAQPRAQLVVADIGGVVETVNLVGSCATSPCNVDVTLPTGILANARATGVYEFGIRYWDASNPSPAFPNASGGSMKWARSSAFVNLRSSSAGSVSINLP